MSLEKVAELRRNYQRAELLEDSAPGDPFELFESWFADAVRAELPEPNAMTLATCGISGQPTARIVLLKGFSRDGFVFYSNLESRKGCDMADNPHVALVFHWNELERQVNIQGGASVLSADHSEAYFKSRPHGSQLGAWASRQSSVIGSRGALVEALRILEKKWAPGEVPLPPFWRGFLVKPTVIQFWQGRSNRLHDRLEYRWERPDDDHEARWSRVRLSP